MLLNSSKILLPPIVEEPKSRLWLLLDLILDLLFLFLAIIAAIVALVVTL